MSVLEARLDLPVRPRRADDDDLRPFGPPEAAEPVPVEIMRPTQTGCFVHRDVADGTFLLEFVQDYGGRRRLVANGLEFEDGGKDTFTIVEGDPLSAVARSTRTSVRRRGDWSVRIETDSRLSGDAESFHVTNAIDAYEGNVRVWARTWTQKIARDGV
jgi:hypothetical protein